MPIVWHAELLTPNPWDWVPSKLRLKSNSYFPMLVGRMDSDTTKGKHGHRDLINRFAQHDLDILVGTQMLTKGWILGGYASRGSLGRRLLNFQDFRAHERAFQMLLQVSGRAGRKDRMGRVLIQTYDNNHLVLQQLQQYDYDSMFSVQLKQREEFGYPPFVRLIRFELYHNTFAVVEAAAHWFSPALHHQFSRVLGPQSPPVARIRNQFLMQILLKLPASQSAVPAKGQLTRICKRFEQISAFRSVKLTIDIDPI